jgi:hypothetical protein
VRGALTILLAGILLTSSFIGQASPVFGDPNAEKQNSHENQNQNILEFNEGVVLSSSSTTTICHAPPGNPSNAHTIIVGTSSLTAHLKNHNDILGECTFEKLKIKEFTSGDISTNSLTLGEAITFLDNTLLQVSSGSKVGPAVSDAAQLHKSFAHQDKETKKEFQKAFLEFIKNVKAKIGKGQNIEEKVALNDLGKASIKINSQITKDEREEEKANKIETAINLKIEKENLQNIRNQISMAKINHDTDNERFDLLVEEEKAHLTKVLIFEAKSNGEKITIEKIKEINKKSSEIANDSHKTSLDEKRSDSNKGQGSSDNSNKGGNDKKPKKSNGKSNGKSK